MVSFGFCMLKLWRFLNAMVSITLNQRFLKLSIFFKNSIAEILEEDTYNMDLRGRLGLQQVTRLQEERGRDREQ